jgi:hypothetical protein
LNIERRLLLKADEVVVCLWNLFRCSGVPKGFTGLEEGTRLADTPQL